MSGSRRRRWPWVLSAVLAVLALTAFVVSRFVFRDRARAVTVEQAVERYNEATVPTTVPPTASPTVPTAPTSAPVTTAQTTPTESPPAVTLTAPGVYRYRTVGKESIDILSGADHGYPQETTITVTPDGCGVLLRWDALRERRDEWRLCATAKGILLQPDGLQYHEFFGQPDSEEVRCTDAVLIAPVDGDPPSPVTQECTLDADRWLPVWTVLERTTLDVGGTAVDVRHVRMTITDDDKYSEHTVVDWYLSPGGLPVTASSTKDSVSPSPIGSVTYHEEYTLQLESLTPVS